MQKYTLTKIYRSFNDKDGKPLIGKNQKPYEKVAIKVAEYGDKWIGGFGSATNKNWQVGDVVELEITQNEQWLNFKEPNQMALVNAAIENIREEIKLIHERLNALEK